MCRNGSREQASLRGALGTWLVLGAFVTFLAAGQASATLITNSFQGFPPDPFVQQDKTWGGWMDVTGNLPSNFTTLITTRSNIVAGQDLHTFSLGASFLPNTTYVVSYYIMVNTTGVDIADASAGIRATIPGAMMTTTFAEIPSFSISTTDLSGLIVLPSGPYTLLHVTDTITTGDSDITGFSNSFLENVPVPEPGALALFGTGILGVAAVLRRRLSN